MTSIALRGKDSVVVCCQKKVPDKLIVPDSVTNIFSVSDHCGAIIVGNMNDARAMVWEMRQAAATFKMNFAYEMPIHMIAKKIGGHLHKCSM